MMFYVGRNEARCQSPSTPLLGFLQLGLSTPSSTSGVAGRNAPPDSRGTAPAPATHGSRGQPPRSSSASRPRPAAGAASGRTPNSVASLLQQQQHGGRSPVDRDVVGARFTSPSSSTSGAAGRAHLAGGSRAAGNPGMQRSASNPRCDASAISIVHWKAWAVGGIHQACHSLSVELYPVLYPCTSFKSLGCRRHTSGMSLLECGVVSCVVPMHLL